MGSPLLASHQEVFLLCSIKNWKLSLAEGFSNRKTRSWSESRTRHWRNIPSTCVGGSLLVRTNSWDSQELQHLGLLIVVQAAQRRPLIINVETPICLQEGKYSLYLYINFIDWNRLNYYGMKPKYPHTYKLVCPHPPAWCSRWLAASPPTGWCRSWDSEGISPLELVHCVTVVICPRTLGIHSSPLNQATLRSRRSTAQWPS